VTPRPAHARSVTSRKSQCRSVAAAPQLDRAGSHVAVA
jgi:hypothetical protein